MNNEALTAIEIEALVLSTLTAPPTNGGSQSRLMAETILRSRRPDGERRCAG
jgi:hypothetical protein